MIAVGAIFLTASGHRSPAPAIRCADAVDSGVARPTSPNYCTALYPTPDLDSVQAMLELEQVSTPFGVAVARDGAPRYALAITLASLPKPSTLGRFRAYVAWAVTLNMDSAVKLGPVHNGRNVLGELARDQFRVLISAESSSAVTSRRGRLVVRGTSPGSRLLAHRDLTTPVPPGAVRSVMPMAMAAGVEPFLPATPGEIDALPEARAPERVAIRSGDTLTLTSSLVKRTIAGHVVAMFAYNGQVPGPTLVAPQDAEIVVRFQNGTALPSAVHWHGVRVENASDGAIGITQEAVPPGGAFTYHVRFPDAGLFWYHAHEREDIQQASGLYGSILVSPPAAKRAPPVDREELLTIGDMLIGPAGPMPFGAKLPTHALMGRYGNTFLVNGATGWSLGVARGAVVRFLITNVSSARVYNLSFANAEMKVVASDQGRFEHESTVQSIVIAPAERYIVDVRFARAGAAVLTNRVEALDHPSGTIYPEVDTLGLVTVRGDAVAHEHGAAFRTLGANEDVAAELERFRPYIDRAPDHTLVLSMRASGLPAATAAMLNGVSVPVDWNDGMGAMNANTTADQIRWFLRDPATGSENMAIDWRFKRGSFTKLRIYNDASSVHPMDHPIHVHGQRMLVLSRNGVPNGDFVWKDTVLVPAGQIVDLLVEMANPGRWMLHCHIAEHRAGGMMMAFTVDSL